MKPTTPLLVPTQLGLTCSTPTVLKPMEPALNTSQAAKKNPTNLLPLVLSKSRKNCKGGIMLLLGYVIGAKPPYKLMKQFIERRWKAFGCIDLFILKAGLFIFNFQDKETKLKVLELGPWSYYDKPLILKPWSPTESYERVSPDLLPVWIRLPHLKLHLWSAKTLSKIASHIGRPLFTDRMTSLRQRLAYARICIEVDKHSNFPPFIEITDFDGRTFKQPVEYEWIPATCEACKQFGHKDNQCAKNVKQEWRPIPKTTPPMLKNQRKCTMKLSKENAKRGK